MVNVDQALGMMNTKVIEESKRRAVNLNRWCWILMQAILMCRIVEGKYGIARQLRREYEAELKVSVREAEKTPYIKMIMGDGKIGEKSLTGKAINEYFDRLGVVGRLFLSRGMHSKLEKWDKLSFAEKMDVARALVYLVACGKAKVIWLMDGMYKVIYEKSEYVIEENDNRLKYLLGNNEFINSPSKWAKMWR